MQELIQTIVKKTGISEAAAKQAVEAVVSFIKAKLPAGIGDQLDKMLSGKPGGGWADMAKNLGGLFGGASDESPDKPK